MPANVDEFVNAVVELAKEVLLESKSLADVVTAEDGEEKFPEYARQAATATSKLIEVVNIANFAPPTMQDELLQATREARDCLLELCRATKAAIANPYDFLTTQKLQNCRKGIAVAIKAVLDIAEALREAPLDSVEKILEEAKSSVQAIGRMVVAARGQNQETFVDTAKIAAASMSKLIEASKSRVPQQQEALFASTQAIIKRLLVRGGHVVPVFAEAARVAQKHLQQLHQVHVGHVGQQRPRRARHRHAGRRRGGGTGRRRRHRKIARW